MYVLIIRGAVRRGKRTQCIVRALLQQCVILLVGFEREKVHFSYQAKIEYIRVCIRACICMHLNARFCYLLLLSP